jgi:dTDP-4-amino-4,6-dideoxygalactose transaminase
VAKRRQNARRLTENLEKAKSLQLPTEPEGFKCCWYLYTVRLKNAKREKRDDVVEKLKQRGIDAFICYLNPIHLMPYYRRFGRYRLPETEKASTQVLSLPVHPGVTAKQIDFISESLLHLVK